MAKSKNRRGRKTAGKNMIARFGVIDVKKRDELASSVFGAAGKSKMEKPNQTSANGTTGRLVAAIVKSTGNKPGWPGYGVSESASQTLGVQIENLPKRVNPNVTVVVETERSAAEAILKKKERIARSVGLARAAVRRELK